MPEWLGAGAALRDFTTAANVNTVVPQYVFYLELFDEQRQRKAIQDLDIAAIFLDQALASRNRSYANCRRKGILDIPAVKLVSSGAFDALHNVLVERHPTKNRTQIKVPINLKLSELVEVMETRVLAESNGKAKFSFSNKK